MCVAGISCSLVGCGSQGGAVRCRRWGGRGWRGGGQAGGCQDVAVARR